MTDERDDLLREIGEALSIEPSPAFAAGVRERIAAEPTSIWRRRGLWLGAGAASLMATAAVALLLMPVSPRGRIETAPQGPPTVAGSMPSTGSLVASSPAAPTTEPLAGEVQRATRSARRNTPQSLAATATDSGAPRHLEVLIPSDEAVALRRLLSAMKGGRTQVAPARVAIDPDTGDLLPLEDIVIPPITIGTLGDREVAGGRRER